MEEFEFVDAHHHLWDLSSCRYPWLEAKGEQRFFGDPTPIQTDYLLDDFLNESPRFRPQKSVHIQVGVAVDNELRETEWLHNQHRKPEALVCFVDLASPQREAILDAQMKFERVRGVRHILGRHREEDVKHGSDKLIENPEFLRGLQSLAARGLSFDLQLIPEQHLRVASMLTKVDSLPVAVCHAGSPWDQSRQGLETWQSGLRKLAERPATVVKISGLGMFKREWQQEDIERIALPVIDIFGPERVMVGSNFPVDKLYHSYEAWWQAIQQLMSRFNASEQRAMLVECSSKFYRI